MDNNVLPFAIFMGDHEAYLQSLTEELTESNMLLEDKHWTLVKMNNQLLGWVIGEEVTNLKHQFITFRTAQVHIFINYHRPDLLDKLEEWWRQVNELGEKISQVKIWGLNFHPKLKHRKVKLLQWCIDKNSLPYEEWQDDHEWHLGILVSEGTRQGIVLSESGGN